MNRPVKGNQCKNLDSLLTFPNVNALPIDGALIMPKPNIEK